MYSSLKSRIFDNSVYILLEEFHYGAKYTFNNTEIYNQHLQLEKSVRQVLTKLQIDCQDYYSTEVHQYKFLKNSSVNQITYEEECQKIADKKDMIHQQKI
ncbi:2657_t:CDS:2 [Ambispora gerdemannii]|uniref:2657_t:CDS:1 n=1 Tax=Ambispora gerdemannii TaxID=144530 RepID=A0A9N9C6D5_9GLOM|nr:2657_t:CDS:2 [Ambispora gerdemannii]